MSIGGKRRDDGIINLQQIKANMVTVYEVQGEEDIIKDGLSDVGTTVKRKVEAKIVEKIEEWSPDPATGHENGGLNFLRKEVSVKVSQPLLPVSETSSLSSSGARIQIA